MHLYRLKLYTGTGTIYPEAVGLKSLNRRWRCLCLICICKVSFSRWGFPCCGVSGKTIAHAWFRGRCLYHLNQNITSPSPFGSILPSIIRQPPLQKGQGQRFPFWFLTKDFLSSFYSSSAIHQPIGICMGSLFDSQSLVSKIMLGSIHLMHKKLTFFFFPMSLTGGLYILKTLVSI